MAARRIGLGCMRLDDDSVIAAALAAGVRLFDTARAYGTEALLGRALAGQDATIVSKGGMTRPGDRWVPVGTQRQLYQDCEQSLAALGRIDVYLLHAPDPRVPIATSARALEGLRREGMVGAIGLCNVGLRALQAAREVAEIGAVQVAIHPGDDEALYGGLVRHCLDAGIMVMAHSPLGGPKRAAKLARAPWAALAAERGVTAAELWLSWLAALGVVPLPGATRVETARSIGRALDASGTASEMEALWPAARRLRPPAAPRGDGEVVLLMGIQGAGKSEHAGALVAQGYARLNRDARGGRLGGLLAALDAGLRGGQRRWVLDNTYPSIASRARVVEVAHAHGVPVRCVWLDTPLAEAQINAVRRLRARYGRLPGPEELSALSKQDPHAFDPRAQFRYERALEPPDRDEGFAAIERRPFTRRPGGGGARGVILQCEGVLRRSRSGARAPVAPGDVVLVEGIREALARLSARGYRLFGMSWQPQIAEGAMTLAEVEACFAATREAAGVDIAFACCPHGGGAPNCWCRSPLPGLVIGFVDDHGLDVSQSLLVGRAPADRTLAERVGLRFMTADALRAWDA